MNQLQVFNQNGQLLVDSREVALMIGRDHSNLMRDIRGYIQIFENSNLNFLNFFIPSFYKVEGNNKTYDCFHLTRKGCDMVANKMTGEKGVLFTAEYVTKFDEMEKHLASPGINFGTLSPQLQIMIQIEQRTTNVESDVAELKQVVDNEVWITESQRGKLREAVNYRAGQLLKAGYGNAHFQGIYSSLKTHFGVAKYDKIPRKDFDIAMDLVRGWYPKTRVAN